jgi:hypothetical protein
MPKTTSEEWLARLHEEVESDLDADATEITRRLELLEDPPDGDPPAESTVRRRRNAYLARPAEQRVPFKPLRWPETFIEGHLPWEASAPLLRVMRDHLAATGKSAITVRWASWYWRLYQAAPAAPSEPIRKLAGAIAAQEIFGEMDEQKLRAVEAVLAFEAYTPEGFEVWWKAVEQGRVPPFPFPRSFRGGPRDLPTLAAAANALDPSRPAEDWLYEFEQAASRGRREARDDGD